MNEQWYIQLALMHPYMVYLVIAFFACTEGPIVSMLGGLLLRLGYISFIPLYLTVMMGDLVGDSIWYFVGYKYGHQFIKRFGKYVSVSETEVEKVTKIFHHHKNRILIFSKITNGLGLSCAILLTAGMVRIRFWKFLILNSIGQLVWSGALIATGYFIGHLYTKVDTWLGRAGIAMIVIILILLFINYKKYLRKRAENTNN